VSGISLFSLMIGKILFSISFSKNFAKKGSKLIGLNEERLSIGFFGLGKRIIVVSFH
jgi:hypothetical protein